MKPKKKVPGKENEDINRQTYSFRCDPGLMKDLRHVAIDEEKTISVLIEEAIVLLVQKYKSGK